MKLAPTPISAALAGATAGTVMPLLWPHLATDSFMLVAAFMVVVALPAHALVVGFNRAPGAGSQGLDLRLLRRVGVWLLAAVLSAAVVQLVR